MISTSDKLGPVVQTRRPGRLQVVLGDQLCRHSRALRGLDRDHDVVFMAEARHEAEHVPSHPQRTVLFLSAMRYFARELIDRNYRVHYIRLDDSRNTGTLSGELKRAVTALRPHGVRCIKPGEHRDREDLEKTCSTTGVRLDVLPDEFFTCSLDFFNRWAAGRIGPVRWPVTREQARRALKNFVGHRLARFGDFQDAMWTGDTGMNCLRHCIGEVLENGHGRHIARLMVLGNFALIAGVDPQAVNAWFLGMYADGVEWATAPNVIGMSQYADGVVVATKPYAASGRYINRMSNYCHGCRYNVNRRTGGDACPFNTFYRDFLIRHRRRFEKNPRMSPALGHLRRITPRDVRAIRAAADRLRKKIELYAGAAPQRKPA
jgi:deoxyribodipyrimidine photolyase-like uncharacterized protein